MDELLAGSDIKELKSGDVVEGMITSVRKHEVWVDLGANGIGVVMRREIGHGQELKEGEAIIVGIVGQNAQGQRGGQQQRGPRIL